MLHYSVLIGKNDTKDNSRQKLCGDQQQIEECKSADQKNYTQRHSKLNAYNNLEYLNYYFPVIKMTLHLVKTEL